MTITSREVLISVLQSLQGLTTNLFPRTQVQFLGLQAVSLKEIKLLKLFQEKYYKRYLINQLIDSLTTFSEDPCQSAFVKAVQSIFLLCDSSINFLIQELTANSSAAESQIISIYAKTSLHRNLIDWFYQLIASNELRTLNFDEIPDNQELLNEIFSKYENPETWKSFFPQSYDLLNLLNEFFQQSFQTIKQLDYKSSASFQFFHQPIKSSNSFLHSDYLRCVLYFYCCQSIIASVIQSNITQSSMKFSSLEGNTMKDYQDILEFFLKYSIQDVFANSSLTSSSSSSSSSSMSLFNDVSSTIQIYIYSMIVKLLIISFQSSSTQVTALTKGRRRNETSRGGGNGEQALQKEQVDQLEDYSKQLVQQFFLSMNPNDFLEELEKSLSGVNQANETSTTFVSSEGNNQKKNRPEYVAQGIKLLLNLGSVSTFIPSQSEVMKRNAQLSADSIRKFRSVERPLEKRINLSSPDSTASSPAKGATKPVDSFQQQTEAAAVPKKTTAKTYFGFIEREVDSSLILQAEEFLKKKYDLLMKEMDERRRKTQWQIKRLQSLASSRRKLIHLFATENDQYQQELQKLKRLEPWMKKTLQEITAEEEEAQRMKENDEEFFRLSPVTVHNNGIEENKEKDNHPDDISDLTSVDFSIEPFSHQREKVVEEQKIQQEREPIAGQRKEHASVVSSKKEEADKNKEEKHPIIKLEDIIEGDDEEEKEKVTIQDEEIISKTKLPATKNLPTMEINQEAVEEVKDTESKHDQKEEAAQAQELVSKPLGCYERILQEFYQNRQSMTHSMNQEGIFETLSSYLPFSLFCLSVNMKSITFTDGEEENDNEEIDENSICSKDYYSLSLLAKNTRGGKVPNKEILRFYHRLLNQQTKPFNLSQDFLNSLLVHGQFTPSLTGNFSLKYFQHYSSYQLMSRYDQQINSVIFHHLFTSSLSPNSSLSSQNLFLHLSVIQQYFLISLKRNFLYEFSSEIVMNGFQIYSESFTDLLMNSFAKKRKSAAKKLVTRSLSAHSASSFSLLSFRKKGIGSLPLLWTNYNIYVIMERLLKANVSSAAPISTVATTKAQREEEQTGEYSAEQEDGNNYFNIFSNEMIQFRPLIHFKILNEHDPYHEKKEKLLSTIKDEEMEHIIWERFFSVQNLFSLQIQYQIFWPLNIFLNERFLNKINYFTKTYLNILFYYHSYQLFWKEMKEIIKNPSFIPSSALFTVPVSMKTSIERTNKYHRLLNIYYYQFGTILTSFYNYFNNRIMTANYHLFHYLIHFYSSFLQQNDRIKTNKNEQQSQGGVNNNNDNSAANAYSSTDLSTILLILESYSNELFEASFQFQNQKNENSKPSSDSSKTNTEDVKADDDETVEEGDFSSFAQMKESIQKNYQRINILSLIKFALQEVYQECAECLICFAILILKEKFYYQQQQEDIANYIQNKLKSFQPSASSLTPAQIKAERAVFQSSILNGYQMIIPPPEERMNSSLAKIKFHLMKMNELMKKLQFYGNKYYHVQSLLSASSSSSTYSAMPFSSTDSVHYKNHIQTLLMYLNPS
jgi:hypothetical protein